MSATLNIITPDHIRAYAEDRLSPEERRDVEAAVRNDDRAARALKKAKAAQSGACASKAEDGCSPNSDAVPSEAEKD